MDAQLIGAQGTLQSIAGPAHEMVAQGRAATKSNLADTVADVSIPVFLL